MRRDDDAGPGHGFAIVDRLKRLEDLKSYLPEINRSNLDSD